MDRIDLKRFDSIAPYTPDLNPYRVKLDANESFLEPSPALAQKLKDMAAEFDYKRYPDPEAKELCRVFGRVFDVDHKRITVGNGSDELISIVISSLLMPGQRLMVLDPDFSMYRFYAERGGIDCIGYEKSAELEADADDIVKAAQEKEADMVIFSNPCNPTGRGIERIDVLRMAKALSDRAFVVDEAYMDFWDQSVMDMAGELPNLIVLRTCSKALGMAGLRVGFAVASRELTGVFKKCKSPYNVTAFSQQAAALALGEPGYLAGCVERILTSRDRLYSDLKGLETAFPKLIQVNQSRTNFIIVTSPRAGEIHDGLKKRGVSVRFTEGLLRITAGSNEEDDIFIAELCEVLKKLEEQK